MESLEQPTKSKNEEILEKMKTNVRKQMDLLRQRRPWDEKLKRWGEPEKTDGEWIRKKRTEIQEEIDLINGAMAEWKAENERLRLQLEPDSHA